MTDISHKGLVQSIAENGVKILELQRVNGKLGILVEDHENRLRVVESTDNAIAVPAIRVAIEKLEERLVTLADNIDARLKLNRESIDSLVTKIYQAIARAELRFELLEAARVAHVDIIEAIEERFDALEKLVIELTDNLNKRLEDFNI